MLIWQPVVLWFRVQGLRLRVVGKQKECIPVHVSDNDPDNQPPDWPVDYATRSEEISSRDSEHSTP